MLKEDFEKFFNPKSVLLIGASRNPYTFNGTILKNLLEIRYPGELYILHPYAENILREKCYKTIEELPAIPDLVIILMAKNLVQTVRELAEFGCKAIMIEVDFGVAESDKETIQEQLEAIIIQYNLRIMGPAMIGIINFNQRFTSSIIPTRAHIVMQNRQRTPKPGISYLAQSGGLTGACGWWKPFQNPPFSKVIHIGASFNISEAEMVEYLFEDPYTKVILLYLRQLKQEMVDVLEQYNHQKPVLLKYGGKEEEEKENFQRLRENTSVVEVRDYIELFEFAKLFLWCPIPKGRSIGIIGPSSGAINLLIAEMRQQGVHLARLKSDTVDLILEKIGGSTCKLGNPVDYWPPQEFIGTQVCKVYHNAGHALLDDRNVSALFLALEFFTEIEFDFAVFDQLQKKFHDKPIIVVLIQAEQDGVQRVIECATRLSIPVFVNEVERSIRAFASLLRYYSV